MMTPPAYRNALAAPEERWSDPVTMKELITSLVQKADLSPEQANKVAEVVKGFLSDKLPEPIKGPVLSALSGEAIDSAADQAKSLLGKLF